MIVHGHLVCRNEVKLVPFVMDYWAKLGVDKLFVWDNGSTDGTLDELKKYSFVEVIPFSTDGGYVDEFRITQMRNTGWKLMSKGVADWVIISDFDEVPYFYGDNFKEWLKSLDASNINRVKTKMHQLIRQDFPEYKEGLMHEYEGNRYYDKNSRFDKLLTFNCKKVFESNFELGSHEARMQYVTGELLRFPKEFEFFHLKYLGKDYVKERSRWLHDNLRPDIKAQGIIDHHYKKLADETDKYFDDFWNNSYDPKEEKI